MTPIPSTLLAAAEDGEWRGADEVLAAAQGSAVRRRHNRTAVTSVGVLAAGIVLLLLFVLPAGDDEGYAVRTGPASTDTPSSPTTADGLIELDSPAGEAALAEARSAFDYAPGYSYAEPTSSTERPCTTMPDGMACPPLRLTRDQYREIAAWDSACTWWRSLEDATTVGDGEGIRLAHDQLDIAAEASPAGIGVGLDTVREGLERNDLEPLRQVIAANCSPFPPGS